MTHPSVVPTIRVKADAEDGFVRINASEFDATEHQLFDKADKHMVPERPAKVAAAEAEGIAELQKQLGEALDRALEAESERDEWKVRAEKAEKATAEGGDGAAKKSGK